MFSFTWVGRNRRRCGEAATPSQATQQRSFCLSEIGKNESWWSLFFQKAYVLVEDFETRGAIKSKEVKNERAKRWVIGVHSWRFTDMSGSKRVDMRKGRNGSSKGPLIASLLLLCYTAFQLRAEVLAQCLVLLCACAFKATLRHQVRSAPKKQDFGAHTW